MLFYKYYQQEEAKIAHNHTSTRGDWGIKCMNVIYSDISFWLSNQSWLNKNRGDASSRG